MYLLVGLFTRIMILLFRKTNQIQYNKIKQKLINNQQLYSFALSNILAHSIQLIQLLTLLQQSIKQSNQIQKHYLHTINNTTNNTINKQPILIISLLSSSMPTTLAPTSIPLIHLTTTTSLQPKLTLNPAAIALIKSYNPATLMSFISICGDYRSGKSFLMNSLFFSKEGFKVSPTTEPCTKGINIWSKPILHNGVNVWVVDTEGFGATDRDDQYDVKIFLLTTLISDILMYNSFGALDQNTINKLASICHKAQSLDPTITQLKMFWLLRDFSLSMQTKQGHPITADQYLTTALSDTQHGGNKEQRLAIKRVFGQRYCYPLVRPVIDEGVLGQLSEIGFEELRGEFVEEIYRLRKKILSVVEVKKVQGVVLGGDNFQQMVGGYLELINSGEVDTGMVATWEKIVDYEKEKFIVGIKKRLREMANKQPPTSTPLTPHSLHTLTLSLTTTLTHHLYQLPHHFTSPSIITQITQQTTMYKDQLLNQIKQKNSQLIANEEKQVLKGIFDGLEKGFDNIGRDMMTGDGQVMLQRVMDRVFGTKQEYVKRVGRFVVQGGGGNGIDCSTNNENGNTTNTNNTNTTLLHYYQHFYHSQRTLLPKLLGHFSQQTANALQTLQQQKKQAKRLQTQLKNLQQQNTSLQHDLQQQCTTLTQHQQSINQLTHLLQMKQHQISTIHTRSQNEYMRIKTQYEENIEQLKETILGLEKSFMCVKKENQLEKQEGLERVRFLEEKNQLLGEKVEKAKEMGEEAIEQVRKQCEAKIKRVEQRFQEVQAQLFAERKKFAELNKSKKEQEGELLEDLAEKNQKLLTLRRQFVTIQHSYKQHLQQTLKQQKLSLQQQFTLQLQQKHHTIHIYQQKLQQNIIRLRELQEVEAKYEMLLVESKYGNEEYQGVLEKYAEVVARLKKAQEKEIETQDVFVRVKERYQQEIKDKEGEIKRLGGEVERLQKEMKQLQQQNQTTITQLTHNHQQQLTLTKQQQQDQFAQTLHTRLVSLQQAHSLHQQQLLTQLKESFNQIQDLKSVRTKLEGENRLACEVVRRMLEEAGRNQREVGRVVGRYRRKGERDTSYQNEDGGSSDNNNNDNPNSSQPNSVLQLSLQSESHLSPTTPIPTQSLLQTLQILQTTFTSTLQQTLQLTTHYQDLKYTFKQTITQLQTCQTHINGLNQQILEKDSRLREVEREVDEGRERRSELAQVVSKMEGLEKERELLKKEVEVREEIYNRRERSVRENQDLYRDTIANLTEENMQLASKVTKLQIELNRFSDWEGDFLIPTPFSGYSNHHYYSGQNHTNHNNNRSNPSSLQFFGENNQQSSQQQLQQQQYTFTSKLHTLEKENRKLRKQLHSQKQLSLTHPAHQPPSILSTLLLPPSQTHPHLIDSLKKQNLIYRKRVEQLRERQLKLLEEVKQVKAGEKQNSERRVEVVREEFQHYRRRVKEEVAELERRVSQLTEDRYRLKQEMLGVRQEGRDGRGIVVMVGKEGKERGGLGVNQYLQEGQPQQPTNTPHPNNPSSQPAQYSLQITTLKQQNTILTTKVTTLTAQISTLNTQLHKLKDESDKKLASLQLFYEQQLRSLQSEKARIQLQNEKNKTKYEHLLKVNNELIVEVDLFRARANNSMTVREKYKGKISALFQTGDE